MRVRRVPRGQPREAPAAPPLLSLSTRAHTWALTHPSSALGNKAFVGTPRPHVRTGQEARLPSCKSTPVPPRQGQPCPEGQAFPSLSATQLYRLLWNRLLTTPPSLTPTGQWGHWDSRPPSNTPSTPPSSLPFSGCRCGVAPPATHASAQTPGPSSLPHCYSWCKNEPRKAAAFHAEANHPCANWKRRSFTQLTRIKG